jgi:trans-2,3-dihydro-3-hydroxyanthranilate isomerase
MEIKMTGLIFHIVDVFAEKKYAGNQLAVFRNIGTISSDQMQKIANEMHFSETTFILSDRKRKGGYDVRIFTPSSEVPFAGHPTLGTAYVIRKELLAGKTDKVLINLEVGQIPVTVDKGNEEILWMKQIPPTFGKKFDIANISSLLNLDAKDIDSRYPIQEVSTGLPFLIVPLKTLDATRRARVDRTKDMKKTKDTQTGDILVFSTETYNKENDLNVRAFVDLLGIPEDPATGSANGCLAAYLSQYRYFGDDAVNVRVEQGYEIGRPSLLYLKAEKRGGEIHVSVGGKVVMVANGEFI